MELSVWSPDFGLASVDPHCLQMMAYAKFSGAPVQVHPSRNPMWTVHGDFPVFRHLQQCLTDYKQLVNYLRDRKFSAVCSLDSKQLADVSALSEMIEDKLYPAFLYINWIDEKNFNELVLPWYTKNIRFPLNMYYPNVYRQRARNLLVSKLGCDDLDPAMETAVYKAAEETITLISRRLADARYLFGDAPTSADAVLYGHLAPLLHLPFPNAALQFHVKACGNLVNFVARVSHNYFGQHKLEFDKRSREAAEQQKKEPFWSSERWRQLRVCAFAVLAMSWYARHVGFVSFMRSIEISVEE